MKNIIMTSSMAIILFAASCSNNAETKTTATDSNESANKKLEEITPDYHTYPQYLYCKIDGQPYVAYYADGHTTGITNTLNMASRVAFSTSADQVTINGETKISEFQLDILKPSKGVGTYTGKNEFYAQGHTDFLENGKLKYVRFAVADGQQLTITSNKDGMLEGTFSFDVVDEQDAKHVLKITEGNFKLKQGDGTSIKVDKNGDVNMDSLLKSVQ